MDFEFLEVPLGIETAECFWSEDLSEIKGKDFQLFLKYPLSEGDVTKLSAQKGEQNLSIKVIGFEDISVVAGVFRNCAKIQIDSNWLEGESSKSTFWLAKGVGVVKWMKSTGRTEEITSYQFPAN